MGFKKENGEVVIVKEFLTYRRTRRRNMNETKRIGRIQPVFQMQVPDVLPVPLTFHTITVPYSFLKCRAGNNTPQNANAQILASPMNLPVLPLL